MGDSKRADDAALAMDFSPSAGYRKMVGAMDRWDGERLRGRRPGHLNLRAMRRCLAHDGSLRTVDADAHIVVAATHQQGERLPPISVRDAGLSTVWSDRRQGLSERLSAGGGSTTAIASCTCDFVGTHRRCDLSRPIRAIRSAADYEAALARIGELMDAEPDTAEGDELDVLADLVEFYEHKHFPMGYPSPIDAIRFRMEQDGPSPEPA